MAGTETLAFTISKYAWKLVKAGKATLEKGGVKDLGGKFIELAKPIVTDTAKKCTFATINPVKYSPCQGQSKFAPLKTGVEGSRLQMPAIGG